MTIMTLKVAEINIVPGEGVDLVVDVAGILVKIPRMTRAESAMVGRALLAASAVADQVPAPWAETADAFLTKEDANNVGAILMAMAGESLIGYGG